MKNFLIMVAVVAAYAWVSNQDYEDALLADKARECEHPSPIEQPATDKTLERGAA